MSNDFFDPRGFYLNINQLFIISQGSSTTNSSSEWVDFQGTSNNKNSTSSPIEENIQQVYTFIFFNFKIIYLERKIS